MEKIIAKRSVIIFTILYCLLLIGLCVYSFALVDPNITFVQHPLWVNFRDFMVQLGYHQRELSWRLYVGIVVLLFLFHYIAVNRFKDLNVMYLAGLIAVILLLAYPLLSHDLFNYLFDAKILTFYHENPYLKRAIDYPTDDWTRFMHWTHRTYPYGPIFLPITLIPSFLAFGKFILNYVFFKLTFVLFYLLSVWILQKMNKKIAIVFATHPLILLEGLVNSHNEIIAVGLGIIGVYYLAKNNHIASRLALLFSVGIKYMSAPVAFLLHPKHWKWNFLLFLGYIACYMYLFIPTPIRHFGMEIQPWYFLNFFIFLPLFSRFIRKWDIFFAGLIFSYYPYIFLGGWDTIDKVVLKHQVMITFFVLNVIYFMISFVRSYRKGNFSLHAFLCEEVHISKQK